MGHHLGQLLTAELLAQEAANLLNLTAEIL